MFNFRLINTPDGNQIIDTTLKTPYDSITPIEMMEYIEIDAQLDYMERMERKQKREAERKPSYGDADYRSPAQIRASQARKHSPKRGPAPKKHDMKDVDKMLLTQSLENEFHAGNRRKR